MNLVELRIEREKYGEHKGSYRGFIEFDNELGKISIILTEEDCSRLFDIVGDGIVSTAKEAAANLSITTIEHKVALENGE